MSSKKEQAPATEAGAAADPPPKSRKKLMLMILPLILCGIGGGLWFSGIVPGLLGKAPVVEHDKLSLPIFVDLPEMITNLNGSSRRPTYVKLSARLEVAKIEDVERVKASMPRLQDMFQTYMREMRPEELRGSAGSHRLRAELLARAGLAVAPAKVIDVLFVELLVQ